MSSAMFLCGPLVVNSLSLLFSLLSKVNTAVMSARNEEIQVLADKFVTLLSLMEVSVLSVCYILTRIIQHYYMEKALYYNKWSCLLYMIMG